MKNEGNSIIKNYTLVRCSIQHDVRSVCTPIGEG